MGYPPFFILLIFLIIFAMLALVPGKNICFWIQGFIMWILLSFNTGGMDYKNNNDVFNISNINNIVDFFADSGLYRCLCNFFRSHDYTFYQMNFFLSSIALLVILVYIYINSNRPNLVLTLCFLFPFTDYIIQKRNFLIVPILLIMTPHLFKKGSKNTIFYLLGCIICGVIHVVGYVYVLYLIFYKILSSSKLKKYMLQIICIIFCIEIALLPIIPKIAALFFPSYKVELYFYTLKPSLLGSLYSIAVHGLLFVIIEYICRRCKNKCANTNLLKNVGVLNRCSVIFIPLYTYGAVFSRIYIYLLPYMYLSISNINFRWRKVSKSVFVSYVIILMGICSIAFMNYGLINDGLQKLVYPLIIENRLIEWFVY